MQNLTEFILTVSKLKQDRNQVFRDCKIKSFLFVVAKSVRGTDLYPEQMVMPAKIPSFAILGGESWDKVVTDISKKAYLIEKERVTVRFIGKTLDPFLKKILYMKQDFFSFL